MISGTQKVSGRVEVRVRVRVRAWLASAFFKRWIMGISQRGRECR